MGRRLPRRPGARPVLPRAGVTRAARRGVTRGAGGRLAVIPLPLGPVGHRPSLGALFVPPQGGAATDTAVRVRHPGAPRGGRDGRHGTAFAVLGLASGHAAAQRGQREAGDRGERPRCGGGGAEAVHGRHLRWEATERLSPSPTSPSPPRTRCHAAGRVARGRPRGSRRPVRPFPEPGGSQAAARPSQARPRHGGRPSTAGPGRVVLTRTPGRAGARRRCRSGARSRAPR